MQRKFISRRSFLKCAGVGAVTAAAAGLLAGCGGSDSSSSSTASSAAPAEPADPNKPYAGVTLYYAATDTEATGPEMQDIVAMVKEKTGINIASSTSSPRPTPARWTSAWSACRPATRWTPCTAPWPS